MKDGLIKEYYEDRSLCREVTYKDDKIERLFREYYENGNIRNGELIR